MKQITFGFALLTTATKIYLNAKVLDLAHIVLLFLRICRIKSPTGNDEEPWRLALESLLPMKAPE